MHLLLTLGLQRDAREQLPLWHGETQNKCAVDGMTLGAWRERERERACESELLETAQALQVSHHRKLCQLH